MSQSPNATEALTTSTFTKYPTNYQPNLFTESRHEFTELEKKIVVLVVNQIGHMALKGEIKPGWNVKFTIPFTELTRQRYDQISAAADSLQSKRLAYRNDKTEKFDFITPFPRVKSEIVDGKKVIELTMFADVVPHFAELGQRYTKYDIDIMLSLSSVYAQRFYEIVSMFHNRGQHQFRYMVDRLREMLNYPESHSYNDFKKNALVVAQRELYDKAGIIIDWLPTKKEGKRILELQFSIKTQRQIAMESVEQDRQFINAMPINEAIQAVWKLMANYKLMDWQKDLIVSDFTILETFFRVDSELTNGLRPKVKNRTAYLVKSLGIEKQPTPVPAPPIKQVPIFPFQPTDGVSAPLPKSPLSSKPSAGRSAKPQSIGEIFGEMKPGKK
ncbi:hypothetical protein GCM10023189_44780 [Nibrella saemangeumensis]|uniref:Initiator Rep protein WH1 domain-containing protein n=1 Tax=Nibrella saemangeumensis TaxID=1084526 RepID=A0ABP8NCI3_9BACT